MENRKVYMNDHNNLLALEEHMYPLVEVNEPNVFRNMFPYNEVPKIAQQFGLDTSVRVNMMSVVHASSTAVNLTRSLAKAK